MGTPSPSAEHHEYEYDRQYRLLEEGRRTMGTPSPSPSPHGGAPCTTSSDEPRRRTPAWAGAIRGFSNTLWLVITVLLVAPMAMQSTSKEDVFICVGIFVTSLAFPVLGYVFTSDEP